MANYTLYDTLLRRLDDPIPPPPPASIDWTKINIPRPTKALPDVIPHGETIDSIWLPIETFVRCLDSRNPSTLFTRVQYEEAWIKGVKACAGYVRELHLCLEIHIEERLAFHAERVRESVFVLKSEYGAIAFVKRKAKLANVMRKGDAKKAITTLKKPNTGMSAEEHRNIEDVKNPKGEPKIANAPRNKGKKKFRRPHRNKPKKQA